MGVVGGRDGRACRRRRRAMAAEARVAADGRPRRFPVFSARHRTRPPCRRRGRLHRLPHRARGQGQRGRAGAGHPLRHDLFHQHHARQRHRHRPLVIPRFRTRHAPGRAPGRPPTLSRVSVHGLCQVERCGHASAVRLLDVATRREVRAAKNAVGLSLQYASALGGLECAVSRCHALHAGPVTQRAMAARCLSGGRRRPLRRLPFAAQPLGRGEERRALPGWWRSRGLDRARPEPTCHWPACLDGRRTLPVSAHRLFPQPRRGGGADGACHPRPS
ncbi:hypothetical protein D3C73_857250 [compost metagenome]